MTFNFDSWFFFGFVSDLTSAYSKQYKPKPKVEGLGENVTEFEVFLIAFFSSWLISILIWQPMSYLALVIIDFKFNQASDFGKMHVCSFRKMYSFVIFEFFSSTQSLPSLKIDMRIFSNISKKLIKTWNHMTKNTHSNDTLLVI